eukprot:c10928_g1_i2.p1 GENE.c10928_g1_i2~~c10928_g1_i2.p1  ORF type:complete len:513 (-),score=104.67 c10928_g1_i2:267-1805(-)
MKFVFEWKYADLTEDLVAFIEERIGKHFVHQLTLMHNKGQHDYKLHEFSSFAKESIEEFEASRPRIQGEPEPSSWNVVVGRRFVSAVSFEKNGFAQFELFVDSETRGCETLFFCLLFQSFEPYSRSGVLAERSTVSASNSNSNSNSNPSSARTPTSSNSTASRTTPAKHTTPVTPRSNGSSSVTSSRSASLGGSASRATPTSSSAASSGRVSAGVSAGRKAMDRSNSSDPFEGEVRIEISDALAADGYAQLLTGDPSSGVYAMDIRDIARKLGVEPKKVMECSTWSHDHGEPQVILSKLVEFVDSSRLGLPSHEPISHISRTTSGADEEHAHKPRLTVRSSLKRVPMPGAAVATPTVSPPRDGSTNNSPNSPSTANREISRRSTSSTPPITNVAQHTSTATSLSSRLTTPTTASPRLTSSRQNSTPLPGISKTSSTTPRLHASTSLPGDGLDDSSPATTLTTPSTEQSTTVGRSERRKPRGELDLVLDFSPVSTSSAATTTAGARRPGAGKV